MSVLTAAAHNRAVPILIGAAILLSLGMGLRQSLGLFLTPVTRDLALTAADFTLAVAVQNIVWGLSQAPVGAIADRFGLRSTMVAGAGIYVIGLAVMAAAGGAPALIASGVLIGVALSCTASSLALTATARAIPEQRRSKVLGIVSAAGSLGTLLIPLTTQTLLAHQGWQMGVLFFLILAVTMLPAGFYAGGADRLPGLGAPRTTMRAMIGQAARHRPFLVMSGAYFVCGLNLVFLTTHLPTYLAICGQDPMLSAEALAVIGGMNCVGSLLAGWLGGRYPKHILLGMLSLSVAPLVSGLVAEMFGTRYMATLLGISFVMHQVGSSLGALGGGLILTAFGSYDRAWQIGVLVGFAAGVLQIAAGGPTRRLDRESEPGELALAPSVR